VRISTYLISPPPIAVVKPVAVGFDAAYIYVGVDAGSVFVLTTRDASRGKVIAIDPTNPGPGGLADRDRRT